MGIFKNIKEFFQKSNKSLEKSHISKKVSQFLEQDNFISVKDKKEFLNTIKDYQTLVNLNNEEVIKEYCSKHRYDFESYHPDIKNIQNIDEKIKQHNDEYVKRHLEKDAIYLDKIFENIDPNIHLDEEQRNVILRDEDYTLVIAGAGAGKSTTLVWKWKEIEIIFL